MIEQLQRIGTDLLPGVQFLTEIPTAEIDLAIALGNSEISIQARRYISLNAESWSGRITPQDGTVRWKADRWPLGGMVAAALAATEAFKCAIKKLKRFARNPDRMETVFADTTDIEFVLAPADTPTSSQLGGFDCISGGAIINAILYVLARIPGVNGNTRVIEPDRAALSNLNRYMLLLHSHLETLKAEDLAVVCKEAGLDIEPIVSAMSSDISIPSSSPVRCWLVSMTFRHDGWFSERIRNGWASVQQLTGPRWHRFTIKASAAPNAYTPSMIQTMRQSLLPRSYLFGQAF